MECKASMTYAYDALNRPAPVTDESGVTNYSYDAAGNLAGYAYPSGVSTTYNYNPLNRLTNMQSICATGTGCGAPQTALSSYAYTLGPTGNRLSVAELSGRTVQYGYDDLYRLTSETVAGAAAQNGSISYTYDAVGNRTQRNSTLPALPATDLLNYDANDRTATDPYDANSNLLLGGPGANIYDFENRLLQAGSIQIVYDGDGNRVQETVAGVTTSYLVADQNLTGYAQVVEELRNGGVNRAYSYGLELINQRQKISGAPTTSFYGFDGHGSVRFLTSSTGAITDTYDYDAFGNLTASTGTTPNSYLFAGEQFDSALGIYYNRARYYDQRRGRFWSADTFDGSDRNPISLHKYLYAGNNPVNQIDPSGNDFDLGSLGAAGAAFTTLATTAFVTFQNVIGAVYLNLYRAPQIIEETNRALTIFAGSFEAFRFLGRNVLDYAEGFSRGPVIRGGEFEEAAGANLDRSFPGIDYYNKETGTAVQIRSTTQTQSMAALLGVVRKGVNRLNTLDSRLIGKDRNGKPLAIVTERDIQERALFVGIPAKPLPWFSEFLVELKKISESEKIAITVQFVEGLEGETPEK